MMTWGPAERGGLTPADGGVTAAGGFRASGIAAGLKRSGKLDLAVVVADRPVACAAVTTTNLVKAAPCVVTDDHAAGGRARAVVVNSGNANACTGQAGLDHARWMAATTAAAVGCDDREVLVLSTGIIGVPPDEQTQHMRTGIPAVVAATTHDGGAAAATAILTTDTVAKQSAYAAADAHGRCIVGGMAKGAGMIEPAMATMLAVVTTDADLPADQLRPLLRRVVDRTFNRISIDACGSTNDTVVLLASAVAASTPSRTTVEAGVEAVCADLARAIVEDGEGTTKVGIVTVTGATCDDDARRLGRAITASVLFRAALHGADPNWGRILAAMGGCGVAFDPARVSVAVAGTTVCRDGIAADFDRDLVAAAMKSHEVEFTVDLHRGDASATLLTADLTPEYVAENAYYTT